SKADIESKISFRRRRRSRFASSRRDSKTKRKSSWRRRVVMRGWTGASVAPAATLFRCAGYRDGRHHRVRRESRIAQRALWKLVSESGDAIGEAAREYEG